MNLEEKKVFEEILDNMDFTKRAKTLLTDIYMRGYHDGRHAERKKLIESGYLIIDPNKKEQLKKDCQDPCKFCEYYTPEYKIGCTYNPKDCKNKQKQFTAIEIQSYFTL